MSMNQLSKQNAISTSGVWGLHTGQSLPNRTLCAPKLCNAWSRYGRSVSSRAAGVSGVAVGENSFSAPLSFMYTFGCEDRRPRQACQRGKEDQVVEERSGLQR